MFVVIQVQKKVEKAAQANRKEGEVLHIVEFIAKAGLTTEEALKHGFRMKSVFARIAKEKLTSAEWMEKCKRKNESKRLYYLLMRHVYDAVFGELRSRPPPLF